ncbi:uncharacterized protein LAESUDRAFT_726785 [Laetiporus sulphureus 93-53]|uniref:PX domain-containing protein n=1 Tax=Laetiporus sulphureus 93-53 TaxID=1314785 RepID=A0A165DS79_9APHY|nr:uncharacterized protein LAESUDRAFT_726785 [Laetiporus sulphureus 93-53]KZT05522.1 hypothetical protein LAESUDRAFT_726785 [Laetiporus sulphureus 93-53]
MKDTAGPSHTNGAAHGLAHLTLDPPSPPETACATPLASPRHLHAPASEGKSPRRDARTYHGRTHSPISEDPIPDLATLTPLRAHYLKKQLITLQFQRELDALIAAPPNSISPFSYLGHPFTPLPKDAPKLELPFLRYCFRHFVLSFPFLAAAPRDFFPEKLQPFLASMLSRNMTTTSILDEDPDDSEETARHKLVAKFERNAAMLMTSGTKLVEKEEVVRLTQQDLDRLEMIAKRVAAREKRMRDMFEVNVVCVRAVTEKGRVRSRVHEEFIVRTRRSHHPDVYVSRRYGDFKTLADELRKAHPSESVPSPPAKDRTIVNVSATSSSSSSASSPSMPGMYSTERNSSADSFSSQGTMSPTSPTAYSAQAAQTFTGGASRLAREKNRLTLRAYLHTLLAMPVLASSPVLKSFLLANPTRLSREEIEDARKREDADKVREDGRKRFAKEIAARVDGLREAARSVKGELFAKDGLTNIFATIKVTDDIHKLPANYQAVIEWARISLASTVFQHFVAADSASESFASLKRVHGLMPYFMLKTILKISNPIAMIRNVLDLFLAQPFGGKSLLQRMFTGSLQEDVRAIEEDIEGIKENINDPIICEKVRQFVYAPREIQAVYKSDAASENIHILAVVLRSGDEPPLSRVQLQRVMRAHFAYKEYLKYLETLDDSDDDEGPQTEEAWLFEDLSVLARLYSRLREREQLIGLIFEGTTAELLKDIITIFYAPLAQVYRAASIADSLSDLQNFINDLIRTVELTEDLSQQDPAKTVQTFIDLIKRHEPQFYLFVHKVHSKGEGLFTNLMRWIERFLTLMRDGLGDRVSMEFLLPHIGGEREEIVKEIDAVALYHYKLKVAYEDKVRRRFGRTQGMNDADAEDEVAAEMVNGVMKDLSFGELVQGEADDLAAEDTDSDEDESDDSSFESDESYSNGGGEYGQYQREGPFNRKSSSSSASSSVKRSHTIAHVPIPRSPSKLFRSKQKQREEQPQLPLRHSRSFSTVHSNASKLSKLSTHSQEPPKSAPADQRSMSRGRPHSTPQKKKQPPPIQPPELHRLPELLPIFVEMVRPLLRTQ